MVYSILLYKIILFHIKLNISIKYVIYFILCKIKYFYKMTYWMGIVVLMKNVQQRGLKKVTGRSNHICYESSETANV
jgi:hypothetical protein